MKRGPSYKFAVPIEEILQHPDACLVNDVLSASGATVIVPRNVPIRKLSESLGDPTRIIDSLRKLGIGRIEVVVRQDFETEELFEQLGAIDPGARIIAPEVSRKVEGAMKDIYAHLTVDRKFNIPKKEIDELATTLSKEISGASQIALSLAFSDSDTYAQTHALNVSLIAGYLAKRLAGEKKIPAEFVEKTVASALLFDIGKSAIPREILGKLEPLSEDEVKVIRTHTRESVRICKDSGVTDPDILGGVLSHHERWDGAGYPDGLIGDKIPQIARILAVADTFDAMTSSRAYRDAVSARLAFNFVMSVNETHFDPDVCRVFMSGMGIYPPGSMVELSNGLVGTVAAITEGNLLQPKIAIKREDGTSKVLDLGKERLFIKRSLDAPL